jgi:energy-coupling factor transporter ATP-binding protein EcfA2
MKRKLCTALSLIGNPPVVCMDEPSSGLDPSSRRNLWKVINETMRGRAVVLTTHLLDEAEALCGRIAIMCFGEVQCIGSAQHLRSKHGSDMGYQVILTTKELGSGPARNVAFVKVDAFVQNIFDGNAKLVNRHSRMLTYSVPSNNIHVPSAFSSLEGHLEPLQLDSYTICQPTLEQVFLKFTVEKDREHSALTNDAERLMAEAFDDTDIRIASAAVSRCCGLERPQHKRNACRFGILAPIFCLIWIFGSYSIADVLAPMFLNEKRQYYLPKSELTKRSRCLGSENSLPELDRTFEYSFTKYGSLQDNQTDFCRGLAVPIALNPNWHITNFSISVGISGDFDSKSSASLTSEWVDDDSVPPNDWNWDDDPGKGYWRSYREDIWNEQVQVFLQNGFDLAPMSNWSYTKWWQQGGNDKFGLNLGSCGGCPHDKTEWGWYDDWTSSEDRARYMANCSGKLNSWNTYTPIEGRCQAECDSPFFATCIPQVSAHRNVNDYWSSFRDNGGRNMGNIFQSSGANNFTVLALLDSGVSIRSCDTGVALQIKVGVNYECDNSTGANCAASGQFDVDNQITQGSTVDFCAFYDGWDGKEYFGSGKLFAGVFFTLDGLFAISLLCCICACCGMCCTKTPEDDSNAGLQPKKKGRWF